MTYVDPSADLPSYLRQGTGPNGVMPGGGVLNYPATTGGGPNMGYPALNGGPTGGPSGAPQGGGQGGAMAWLQYIAQRFGISLQQAMTMMQSVNPVSSAQADELGNPHGDGPANFGNPAPVTGPVTATLTAAPAAVPQPFQGPELAAAQNNRPRPPAPPAGPSFPARPASVGPSGAPLQPGSLSPGALAQFGAGATGMPWRGPMAGDSPANIAAAGGGGPGPVAAAPATAAAPAAAAQGDRFIGIDRPNAPATGGPYGRSGLQGTALNLAGLFNRQQAQPPSAAVPGPLAGNARPDLAQRTPLANAPMPPVKPTDIQNAQIANALKNRNWWQNL